MNITSILQAYFRKSAGILRNTVGYCRNAAGTLHQYCGDSVGILPEYCRKIGRQGRTIALFYGAAQRNDDSRNAYERENKKIVRNGAEIKSTEAAAGTVRGAQTVPKSTHF